MLFSLFVIASSATATSEGNLGGSPTLEVEAPTPEPRRRSRQTIIATGHPCSSNFECQKRFGQGASCHGGFSRQCVLVRMSSPPTLTPVPKLVACTDDYVCHERFGPSMWCNHGKGYCEPANPRFGRRLEADDRELDGAPVVEKEPRRMGRADQMFMEMPAQAPGADFTSSNFSAEEVACEKTADTLAVMLEDAVRILNEMEALNHNFEMGAQLQGALVFQSLSGPYEEDDYPEGEDYSEDDDQFEDSFDMEERRRPEVGVQLKLDPRGTKCYEITWCLASCASHAFQLKWEGWKPILMCN